MGTQGREHITSAQRNLANSLLSLKMMVSRDETKQAKKFHKIMQNVTRTESFLTR